MRILRIKDSDRWDNTCLVGAIFGGLVFAIVIWFLSLFVYAIQ